MESDAACLTEALRGLDEEDQREQQIARRRADYRHARSQPWMIVTAAVLFVAVVLILTLLAYPWRGRASIPT